MLQPGSVFNTDQKLYHLVQETSSVYRVVCPERSAVLIRVLCFYCIIFPNQVLNVFLMHINWEMALVQFRGRSKFGDSLLIQIIAKKHTYCDILPIFSIFKCHLPRVWRAMFKELTALRNYVLIWNAQLTLKNKRWWFGPRTNKQSVHYWDSF